MNATINTTNTTNTTNATNTSNNTNNYMFINEFFGDFTKIIVPASNIEEAKKFAFEYDGKKRSNNDFTIVNFDNMLAELQASNNEIISNAGVGDQIEEDKTAFILYIPYGFGSVHYYKSIKNLGKPAEEKSDMHILIKKAKNSIFLYTGNYKCRKHENVSAAFFVV